MTLEEIKERLDESIKDWELITREPDKASFGALCILRELKRVRDGKNHE